MDVSWPRHCGTNGMTLSVVYCFDIVVDGGECPTPHPPLLLHVDLQSRVEALVALIDLLYIVLSSTPLKLYPLNLRIELLY
ncbi:hypothetical protein Tco_0953535 [Tanacetum coccineum]|uniref:Uncharacterized protein n=1 Tax=Tanacetum coccineum TaxID=301880 RepID=A0ABQ5E060_9ASTR